MKIKLIFFSYSLSLKDALYLLFSVFPLIQSCEEYASTPISDHETVAHSFQENTHTTNPTDIKTFIDKVNQDMIRNNMLQKNVSPQGIWVQCNEKDFNDFKNTIAAAYSPSHAFYFDFEIFKNGEPVKATDDYKYLMQDEQTLKMKKTFSFTGNGHEIFIPYAAIDLPEGVQHLTAKIYLYVDGYDRTYQQKSKTFSQDISFILPPKKMFSITIKNLVLTEKEWDIRFDIVKNDFKADLRFLLWLDDRIYKRLPVDLNSKELSNPEHVFQGQLLISEGDVVDFEISDYDFLTRNDLIANWNIQTWGLKPDSVYHLSGKRQNVANYDISYSLQNDPAK